MNVSAVDPQIDSKIAAINRRYQRARMIWLAACVCIPLIGFILFFLPFTKAGILYAMLLLVVPFVAGAAIVDKVIWRGFSRIRAINDRNIAVVLTDMNRKQMAGRRAPQLVDPLQLWLDKGAEALPEPTADLLERFAQWGVLIKLGPKRNPRVLDLVFTALLRSGRDAAARKLDRVSRRRVGRPLINLKGSSPP